MPTLDEYLLLLLMMMEVNRLCQILIGLRYVQTKSRYMQVPKDCFKNQGFKDWLFKKPIQSTIQGWKNPIQSIGVISKFTQLHLYSIILQICLTCKRIILIWLISRFLKLTTRQPTWSPLSRVDSFKVHGTQRKYSPAFEPKNAYRIFKNDK